MINLRILFRKLYIKNREGDVNITTFSILNINIDKNDSLTLQSSLTSSFSVLINSYSIESFIKETANTLYTDLSLYIAPAESGWILSSYPM